MKKGNMKKRIVSLAMVLVMCLGLAVPVMAESRIDFNTHDTSIVLNFEPGF